MAASTYKQDQYSSRDFVESAGAILFDFRPTGITLQQLLHSQNHIEEIKAKLSASDEPNVAVFCSHTRGETLLPKGRRNINEPREVAAIRETYEETGIRCQLFPVVLKTRATSMDPAQDRTNAAGFTLNEVRQFSGTSDPFWMTLRQAKDRHDDRHVKIIWWYVAVADDVQDSTPVELDPGCELRSLPINKVVEACTFEGDREIIREAINIVQETLGVSWRKTSETENLTQN